MAINAKWYQARLSPYLWPLIPFALLFQLIVHIRKWLYRRGWLRVTHLSVPVIVVGNIAVGGTGKTPFVLWLAAWLKARGFHPGIVSRGVGAGQNRLATQVVTQQAKPNAVGDEALLLQASQCPVVVGINRVQAAQQLLREFACDIILTDDGLQHYRLGRTLEIGLVDGDRQLGNGWLLPVGPLREPKSRLNELACVIHKEKKITSAAKNSFCLEPVEWVSVRDETQTRPLTAFVGKRAQAVAGISNPSSFFEKVTELGVALCRAKSFPDHHPFARGDFVKFSADLILMTAKDAVKCREFADERFWYLRVNASISADVENQLQQLLEQRRIKPNANVNTNQLNSVDDEFKPRPLCQRSGRAD